MPSLTVNIPDDLRAFADAESQRRGLSAPGDLVVALLEGAKQELSRKELERALLESLDEAPDLVVTPGFWSDLKAEALSRAR